jgi:hypothetical protein
MLPAMYAALSDAVNQILNLPLISLLFVKRSCAWPSQMFSNRISDDFRSFLEHPIATLCGHDVTSLPVTMFQLPMTFECDCVKVPVWFCLSFSVLCFNHFIFFLSFYLSILFPFLYYLLSTLFIFLPIFILSFLLWLRCRLIIEPDIQITKIILAVDDQGWCHQWTKTLLL